MARYLVLIYGNEQAWATMSPHEQRRIDDGHAAFVAAAGTAVLSAEKLEPTTMSTTVRRGPSSGRPQVTDGPFLESKEGIGGFYLLEAADLDEALALASTLPEVEADHSGVEIRPVAQPD